MTISPDLSPTTNQLGDLNASIVGRLQRPGLGSVLRTVEYRALAVGDGRTVRFAGVEMLARSGAA